MDFSKKWNRDFFNDKLLFKTAGIVFLLIIFFLTVADFRIYRKKRDLSVKIDAYQRQIEDIKKNNQILKAEIANSDSVDYLEKLGYEQFDKTRPGETEYMFIKSPQKTEAVPVAENFLGKKPWFGWLSGVWSWIPKLFSAK